MRYWFFPLTLFLILSFTVQGQHSIAMQWNELLLQGIRSDFARPTVHARNLYHCSAGMYDAWAVYDDEAIPHFLGDTIDEFAFEFEEIGMPSNIEKAREEAISFVMYRLLRHRFLTSPGAWELFLATDSLMQELGYDISESSQDYQSGDPAALGNYLAGKIIAFGLQDGSNEQLAYENTYYEPLNDPLVMAKSGNPDILDPNRWQPLTLDVFIDQSGNEIPFNTPDFLGPEWGNVVPFSMTNEDLTVKERDGNQYNVYHDPGNPSFIQEGLGLDDPYKWGFSLVAIWSSHLGKAQDTLIDISPASFGNNNYFPDTFEDYKAFYPLTKGGDPGQGYEINPHTGLPYEPQMIDRSDYGRVLAEFWADGPESETPPGHWFTIMNYVNTHPEIKKRFQGQSELINDLEWDVKSYLILGGAMHDCAVSAWGIKGFYDYIRPVSAIRYMADSGQSSDENLPNYHPHGFPLLEGYIELVKEGDPLVGTNEENLNEIKIFAWKGPDYIEDPESDLADVDWILAKDWWPYQRPSFVTPPFAGYISGHSTFSRAAAEVLTLLTGDPFFPGGIGEFEAPKNEFLVFEDGPSQDITLQWATYRDASDQTSLSRIWGGIHPPIDDIPGRKIGVKIGNSAFELGRELFYNDNDEDGYYSFEECDDNESSVYPGAPEICDGLDNDCNGEIDEGLQIMTYFRDNDNDGFGNMDVSIDTCLQSAPTGYVIDNSDCNDQNSIIYPGSIDVSDNGIDEDCSGRDASDFVFVVNNDFSGNITIHYPNQLILEMQLINAAGQVMDKRMIDFSDYYVDLSFKNLSTGIYFLVLRDVKNNNIFYQKLILPGF